MEILYLVIFFILGLYFGSFYTVVGLRVPKGEDFIVNRSYCDNCYHNLTYLDMIPVLSFIFLRGKCRYCGKKIDKLSTYMELATGILFALSFYVFGFSYELLIALGLVSMLVILSVSDIRYLTIPDEILIFFGGYFLIISTLMYHDVLKCLFLILSSIALFLIMYSIMILGNFLFKKETLGGGDIKLMLVMGLLFHPIIGLFGIFIGSFLALPVSLIVLLKKKENLIPFGPFLLISFNLLYFLQIDFKTLLNFIK